MSPTELDTLQSKLLVLREQRAELNQQIREVEEAVAAIEFDALIERILVEVQPGDLNFLSGLTDRVFGPTDGGYPAWRRLRAFGLVEDAVFTCPIGGGYSEGWRTATGTRVVQRLAETR